MCQVHLQVDFLLHLRIVAEVLTAVAAVEGKAMSLQWLVVQSPSEQKGGLTRKRRTRRKMKQKMQRKKKARRERVARWQQRDTQEG